MNSLSHVIDFAHTLADDAAQMIAAQAATAVRTSMKPDKTFVTHLDFAIEAHLRSRITQAFPNHGIWGEEFEALRPDAQWVWTLDPIDGTIAFVAGMPVYSTLIALYHHGLPVLGIMHFPATGERWLGAQGRITTCNGLDCHARTGISLASAIMSASSPDFFTSADKKHTLKYLTEQTAWRI